MLFEIIACEHLRTQGTWARKHERHVGTWVRYHIRHVGTWASKHARHVGTWARKHARHVGTWTRKHTGHVGMWARKARNLADSVFWYVKVNIFWKFIQYTLHWNKTQTLKKLTLDKINVVKNALFFLSRAPTHHSFTFNWKFLYELKQMIHFSKTGCGIFHFRFRLVVIELYIFVQQKAWTLWL